MSVAKRIVIEPVTRVEGHGKVTILLDEKNQVKQARLHIVEFRGFERFIQGRPFWEVPVLVQRLCGICPVSHHLAAAKAMDRIVGGEKLTPTAEKMRRLMHYGQMFQSHALHFFHLVSPDLLFGFDADAGDPQRHRRGRQVPRAGRAGRADAQVRPGDHQGHGRQEDPRHRRHPRRHQQEPVHRRARRLPEGPRPDDRLGARRRSRSPRTTRSRTSRSWRPSARSTRTTCRWSAPTARWTSTTATCAPSTRRAR